MRPQVEKQFRSRNGQNIGVCENSFGPLDAKIFFVTPGVLSACFASGTGIPFLIRINLKQKLRTFFVARSALSMHCLGTDEIGFDCSKSHSVVR